MFLGAAGRTPIAFELYEAPDRRRSDVYDSSARLRIVERRVLKPGEFAFLRPQVHAYRAGSAFAANALALVFQDAEVVPLCWKYDEETLAPVAAIPTDLNTSRLRETLRLIGALADARFVPRLVNLYNHPSHFVRWAVIRTLFRVSVEDGMRLAKRACHDRHPQVREAAKVLLAAPAPLAVVEQQERKIGWH
jgi:hypothetical protein